MSNHQDFLRSNTVDRKPDNFDFKDLLENNALSGEKRYQDSIDKL